MKFSSYSINAKIENPHSQPKEIWVNVFIHGIMSIKPHVSWSNFMRFMKDDIEDTLYEKTVALMREDPFFYKNQAMQEIGLHKVNPHMFEGNSSASFAFILDEVSKHYGIKRINHYYTYGWSGLLSSKTRYRDAKDLFVSLEQEIEKLKKQNYIPRVRIIGYSHGGNVGLNLAAVRQKEFPNSQLAIDEMVLLGSPVIADTDYLINDPMFKQVFNLYSHVDRVQPLDFFAPRQLFSNRIFRPRKGFDLPDKLIQIRLKVTRCAQNVCNNNRRFEYTLNLNKPSVVYGKSGLLRDVSPGHAELWFFGWTPVHYRPHYPLYPLPTAAFLPVITYHTKKMADPISAEHTIIADIRPEHNVILFRQHNQYTINSTVAYIPKHKLEKLHEAVLQCKPTLYTHDIYQAHIQDAVKQAQEFMEAKKEEK